MSKASGFVLILAGLVTAAYVLPTGAEIDEADFGRFTVIAKSPEASSESQVVLVQGPRPAPPAIVQTAPSFTTPVVVTIAQQPSAAAALRTQKAAAMPRDREGIGRELQKELRRVGCYDGELNGAWTPATRQAMEAFIDRVNALLPTVEPDSILLTLVRGYPDRVCGMPCPSGQGLSDGGRCVPNAILVRGPITPNASVAVAAPAQRPTSMITGWSTMTAAASPPVGVAPTDGRMALAGPIPPVASQLVVGQEAAKARNSVAPPRPARASTTRKEWSGSFFKQYDGMLQ